MGVPNKILGYLFLFATIALYAGIGFMSKTADVRNTTWRGGACRRCSTAWRPAPTGCRAASFIGMAGTLYLSGYDGLAFVLGWTGGYCLVALFLAPYLRKFGQFTIPDFLGARYRRQPAAPDRRARRHRLLLHLRDRADLRRRPHHQPLHRPRVRVGVFVGLAGILVCSFLGGMKAVTWTQVAQYIILIFAYMIPVVWLSVKQPATRSRRSPTSRPCPR